MVQIVDGYKLVKGNVWITNLLFDNKMVFIERTDFLSNPSQPILHTSIQRVNYITQEVDRFEFKRPADLVTFISSDAVIYYGNINRKENSYGIDVRKVSCANWNDEEVLTIDIEVSENDDEYYTILSSSIFIGVNERYALIALPKHDYRYRLPFFEKVLLIDSFERKVYTIPDKVGESDTLLRMDEVWVANNSYVVFKTGRIRPFEKKQIWEEQTKIGSYTEYHDHLETLLVCDVDEFVNNVKCGNRLDKNNIVQTCDLHGALSLIGSSRGKIVYSSDSFKAVSTEVKTYNLESKETDTIRIQGLYDFILHYNQKVYGLLHQEKCVDIYDIIKKDKVFSTDEGIVYIDDESIITCKQKIGEFKRVFTVRNLKNENVIDTFESRFSEFDYENNRLVLF